MKPLRISSRTVAALLWMAAAAFQAAGRFARYWAVARGMALF